MQGTLHREKDQGNKLLSANMGTVLSFSPR